MVSSGAEKIDDGYIDGQTSTAGKTCDHQQQKMKPTECAKMRQKAVIIHSVQPGSSPKLYEIHLHTSLYEYTQTLPRNILIWCHNNLSIILYEGLKRTVLLKHNTHDSKEKRDLWYQYHSWNTMQEKTFAVSSVKWNMF